ncbi:MAG TPA: TonB-dependent receptor plug domain-containing protein, partial [Micromonospora sp.]
MSRSVTVCSLLIAAGLAASSVRPASAQGVGTITGRVTDSATGSPLAGASVVIVGTQFGALTDATGRYSIPRVPVGTYSVQAQLIGRNPRTVQGVVIRDGETAVVDFQLEEGAIALDEIVAVGYGTVRRRDLTGSVAQVSSERLEARAVTRIEQALMGQMAGVQVRQTNGQPGAPLEVRVRGAASISASNQPLYVVDGVPVEDLSHVNVDDIASIEVLKDAASAAIYGSRGANGVVLVTTRNGSGAPRFQARTSYGFQVLENKVDLLSAEEWIEIYRELQDSAWVRRGRQLGRDYKASDPISFRQSELGTQRNSTYIPDPRWEFGTDSLAFIDWQD